MAIVDTKHSFLIRKQKTWLESQVMQGVHLPTKVVLS